MSRPPVHPHRPELIAMAIGDRAPIEQLLREGPECPTKLVMPSNPGDPIIDCDLMPDGEQCAFGRGHSGPCLPRVPLQGSLTMPPISWPDGDPPLLSEQARELLGMARALHAAAQVLAGRFGTELGSPLANHWAAMSVQQTREAVTFAEEINVRLVALRDMCGRALTPVAVRLIHAAEQVEKGRK